MRLTEVGQARRAGFLAGFDEPDGIETERAAARINDAGQRFKVDRMLTLVVGRAAPVPAVAFDLELPGVAAGFPFGGVAPHHVAVAIHEDRGQFGRFNAARHQDRQVHPGRVCVHRTGKAQRRQARNQFVLQVGMLRRGLRGHFAFGRKCDPARQGVQKDAAVIRLYGVENGLFAGHGGSRCGGWKHKFIALLNVPQLDISHFCVA